MPPTAPSLDVLVLMGSDSDFDTMSRCHALLNELKIPHEIHVASAHRTPARVLDLVADAERRGVKCFICAAGLAAHLAGVVAAHTTRPVIGVPMPGGIGDGLDALLSTVQMPPGVPVATVGVGSGGAKNAAVLASQIIALTDPALAKRIADWRIAQSEQVLAKDAKLQEKLK